jgi:hypothetical protein
MPTEVVRRLSPEGEELAARREELARLEAELADRELIVASLRAELAAFEGLYLRRIGVLYAELDEWNARLAELRAERIGTPDVQTEAGEARSQAQESFSAAHGEASNVQPFRPSPELKSLFREAAKRVHPDTADDEKDRARRERLMKEVNAAYAVGDDEALRRILVGLDNSPDNVPGLGIGADLIRVLRQLRLAKDRLAAIDMELVTLAETDIALLKARADSAASQGLDLLAEMEVDIRGRISAVRQIFEQTAGGEARA